LTFFPSASKARPSETRMSALSSATTRSAPLAVMWISAFSRFFSRERMISASADGPSIRSRSAIRDSQ
jgi:hypothetical protein